MDKFYKTSLSFVLFLVIINGINAQTNRSNPKQFKLLQQSLNGIQKDLDKDVVEIAIHKLLGGSLIMNTPYHANDKSSRSISTFKLDSVWWDVYFADEGQFKKCEKWTYHYNEQLDPSLATYYWYNLSTNEIIPKFKYELTYDPDRIPKEVIINEWNTDWNKFVRISYDYDTAGNLTQLAYFIWQAPGQQWQDLTRSEYFYDSTGNDTLSIHKVHDALLGWVNGIKEESKYDSGNRLTIRKQYSWENSSYSWLFEKRYDYSYSDSGYTVISEDPIYDGDTVILTYYAKYEYHFDEYNNISYSIQSTRDQYGNQWNSIRKTNYTYDNAYDPSDMIIPTNLLLNENSIFNEFKFDVFSHMLIGIDGGLYYDSNWTPDYRGSLYYSDISTNSPSQLDLINPLIYPNPAIDYIIITCGNNQKEMNFRLFNIHGKMIVNKDVQNLSRISLVNLKKGIYITQLKEKDKIIYTSKLIVF